MKLLKKLLQSELYYVQEKRRVADCFFPWSRLIKITSLVLILPIVFLFLS